MKKPKDNQFQYFKAGEIIFKEGQRGDFMYVVVDGVVEIVVGGRVVETVRQGGLLGEMGLVDDAPRSATAIAYSDCKLIPVTRSRFMFLLQETPSFAGQVMKVMVRRLRQVNRQL
jgi:CRP-like cAMP-binding protein